VFGLLVTIVEAKVNLLIWELPMKKKTAVPLSIAALSMVLFLPGMSQAQNSTNSNSTNFANKASFSSAARQEASDMVPARAYLARKMDAKDEKPGTKFEAILADTVHLKNGTELPSGTKLMGTVTNDELHMKGNAKLALRITKADLKNGKTIPVKATIVGVWAPESENSMGYNVAPGDEQPNDWNKSTLAIDELDALPGVDLHSRIAGNNSGVFVTTKKDDVKLAGGSELALAIGPQGSVEQGSQHGGQ
jgi:hypothetical protein